MEMRAEKRLISVICAVLFCALPVGVPVVHAENNGPAFNTSNLPIPRFVSLATDEVNVRTGPGLRYPVKWIYKKTGMPVEIIREFDVWREIRDADGEEGWVHKSLLSGKRTVLTRMEAQILFEDPDNAARPLASIDARVMAEIKKCSKQWCQVEVSGYSGWIKRDVIWGVYSDEVIK